MESQQKTLKKGIFSTLCLLVLAAFLAPQASAEQVTLFSETYSKEIGAPVTYTDQIQVTSGHSNFNLVIENGPDGTDEVRNFEVALNGVTVMTSSDLKKTDDTAKLVSLPWQQTNELEVTLRGQGGTYLSVELQADFEDPLRFGF